MKRLRALRFVLVFAVLLYVPTGVRARIRVVTAKRAFLEWARQAAIPMPASPEEPLSEEARRTLERMLENKRFLFLGEPDHFFVEKYAFRLTFVRHLFAEGWRYVAMEHGRTAGWQADQYLRTGDASYLHADLDLPTNPSDVAAHGGMLDFVANHEYSAFPEQLRRISESRADDKSRLRYVGFDLDLGAPLASIGPIQSLLEDQGHNIQIQEILHLLDELAGLSIDQQLAQVGAIQRSLIAQPGIYKETLGQGASDELQTWLCFLHDSIRAEKRPRMRHDLRGHRLWRAERERLMMRYLDRMIDGLNAGEKVMLMGHNGHLSKDATQLFARPQLSLSWGVRSWFRALGYSIWARIHRCPLNMYEGSVGTHLHQRFPGEVLAIWTLYGQGQLMGRDGPLDIRVHGDTIESLLAQVGDRFLLPLDNVGPEARAILTHANFRWAGGQYASADLTAQADAIYFIKHVTAE
jgi:hypothetical protein